MLKLDSIGLLDIGEPEVMIKDAGAGLNEMRFECADDEELVVGVT